MMAVGKVTAAMDAGVATSVCVGVCLLPGAPKRSEEQKKLAKDFYKQMIVDSEYQGEDYEVFDRWLGVAQ